jgi:hypothetical protein
MSFQGALYRTEPSVEMVSGYAVIQALWGKRRNHEECHSSNSA